MEAVGEGLDLTVELVWDHMPPLPEHIDPDADLSDVARRMLELGVRHLPVVEGGRVVGMVSALDVRLDEAWASSQ